MQLKPVMPGAVVEPISLSPAQASQMYQRFLAAWASDLLRLRRHGLDRPGVRRGRWEVDAAQRAA